MKPQSNQFENKSAINEILKTFYLQAKAQFGSAIQSYWLHDNNLCPGCGLHSTGEIKYKGKNALSLNAFIYRERGVLIGYFLCGTCAKYTLREAREHPYTQTPLHTTIEKNLIAAYTTSHPKHLI
jgi:hypothetical protein